MANSKTLTFTVAGPTFYTELDEAAFFLRLRQLPAFHDVVGVGRKLKISIFENRIDEDFIREMICIFYRYRLDIKAIRELPISDILCFIDNPNMYWNKIDFDGVDV